jgi:hypothetical protein
MTIVGVVGHVSHTELVGESDKGTYYMSLLQQPVSGAWIVARMRQGLAERPALIGDAVHGVDPTLPIERAGTMSDLVWRSLAPRRFVMGVLAFFAAVALLMAALGLYGVITYSVAQRAGDWRQGGAQCRPRGRCSASCSARVSAWRRSAQWPGLPGPRPRAGSWPASSTTSAHSTR